MTIDLTDSVKLFVVEWKNETGVHFWGGSFFPYQCFLIKAGATDLA